MNFIDCLDSAGLEALCGVPLSEHSTFRIGGAARYAVFPDSPGKIAAAIAAAKQNGIRFVTVGKASNILFADEGFDGLVIFTEKCNSVKINGNTVVAGCGASLTGLASKARDAGLSGLEFAYGIPGTVGGAVFMNAGAYGGEMSRVTVKSSAYDAERGEVIDITDHRFGYRKSVYQERPELTVLSAELVLTPSEREPISAAMEANMKSRKEKQPLGFPNAGSVFKRPEGYFAGKLIEDAGLKGYSIGGAEVSEKHAGFVINRGGATASDVLRLVEHIKKTVFENSGVALECEIRYIV